MASHTKDGGVVDWSAFGDYLRSHRSRLGLSQKDFAAKLGCKQADVSRYEAGQRQPTVEVLVRYAQTLDIPPQQFTAQLLACIRNK